MMQIPDGEFVFPKMSSVVFGLGAINTLAQKVDECGAKRAFIVTVPELVAGDGLVGKIETILSDRCAGVFSGVIQHNAREGVLAGAKLAREVGADILISVGGGSTADAGKGINIVLTQGEDLGDFRIRHEGDKVIVPQLKKPRLPQIAIPTTLSAAEFTNQSGITDTRRKHQDAFRHPELAPKVIILDPQMTVDTPRQLWASSGMKLLSDCFEQFCSPKHHPFVDGLVLHSIRIINQYLVRSVSEPIDLKARAMLQHTAWMTLYGIRSVGAALVAAFRHQLSPLCGVPHAIVSTILFPHCMNFNRPLIDERLAMIAKTMDLTAGRSDEVAGTEVIERATALIREVELPSRLRDVGVRKRDFKAIAEAVMEDTALNNNPKPVESADQLLTILEQAW